MGECIVTTWQSRKGLSLDTWWLMNVLLRLPPDYYLGFTASYFVVVAVLAVENNN